MYKDRFKISVNHGDESLVSYVVVLMMFFVTYMSSLSILIIHSRRALQIIQICAFVLYLCFKPYKKHDGIHKRQFVIFLLFLVLQILHGFILYQDNDLIYAITFCAFFIFASADTKWHIPLIKVLGLMGIVYAVSTLILIPLKSVYINLIAPMYTGNYSRLIEWYDQGHYPGITDHYSTNGMMIINGLFVFGSALFYDNKNKINTGRFKNAVYFVLVLGALIMCGKRAHFLFGAIALILGYFVYTSNEKNRYFKYFGIACALLLVLVFGYYFIPAINNVVSRFFDMGEDVSILGRYQFWDVALRAFDVNKLFGIGWFGFRTIVAPKVYYTGHAHNVYIQLLCETGIVGFSVIVVFFAYFLYKGYDALRCVAHNKSAIGQNRQILVLFAFMYQIYFLLYCVTGNPLYDGYVFPVYFASCSMSTLYSQWFKERTRNNESGNPYLS